MEKTIQKYNDFIANEYETWKSRFTWCGLDGRTPKHTTTILKFFAETNILENIDKVTNTTHLFQQLCALSERYTDWVSSKGKTYKKKEYEDMKNFFIGAVGEFFFVELLNEVRGLYVYNPFTNIFDRYDFHYVSPTLSNTNDFGVDLTGVANDISCVFQIKFWNPFGKHSVGMEVFQKADSEGIRNNFIKQEENNNIFLCWLGGESCGERIIKENKVYKNKIVVIGKMSLDASINERNTIFWNGLYDKLIQFATK